MFPLNATDFGGLFKQLSGNATFDRCLSLTSTVKQRRDQIKELVTFRNFKESREYTPS
jgi:hypothetical protein